MAGALAGLAKLGPGALQKLKGVAGQMPLPMPVPGPTIINNPAADLAKTLLEEGKLSDVEDAFIKKLQAAQKEIYDHEHSMYRAAMEFINTIRPTLMFAELIMYLTPFILIIILYFLFRPRKSSTPSLKRYYNNTKGFFAKIKKFFKSLIKLSHRTKNIFNIFGSTDQTNARYRIGGRCDNITWVETDGDGNIADDGAYCETSVLPDNIQWKLDTSKMPEYGQLPKNMKDIVKGNLNVTIPFDHNDEASFYVPQCEKAVFTDTCDKNDPTNLDKCQKANLLEDNGMSCRLKEQTSLSYKAASRCSNSQDVGIVDPKNVRILTLLKRLQNKLDGVKTSDDMIAQYNTYTTSDDAIKYPEFNNALPNTYSDQMNSAKNSNDFKTGQVTTFMRKALPTKLSEIENPAKKDSGIANLF